MSTIRTFIAIELDEELKDSLRRLQGHLGEQMAPRSVRWVRPRGHSPDAQVLGRYARGKGGCDPGALAQAAASIAPFTFTVGGLGCFPSTRRPRVVWVGLGEPTGALAALRNAVEAHVAPLGFPQRSDHFIPI